MSYYFTSDLHLSHRNIIKYCNRPFDDVEEMNRVIRNRWNFVVNPDDIVYILGDVSFRGLEDLDEFNGLIHILPGSHDGKLKQLGTINTIEPSVVELKIPDLMDEYGNQRTLVLCHYAMRVWPLSHYASWHLFGHSHGNLPPYGLSFDVGIDTNEFYPYSLEDIKKKMATLTPIVDFRKGK
jgi:calcineurin-like phosphoesterase family protein